MSISICFRYISILPPVYLGFNIDIPESTTAGEPDAQVKNPKPFLDSSLQSPDPRDMPISSHDPEYYFNALSCVGLGVIVMIVLFFVCKYLNDLQIRPRSRKSFRDSGLHTDDLVEAIPLSLKGHPQVSLHVHLPGSFIPSFIFSSILLLIHPFIYLLLTLKSLIFVFHFIDLSIPAIIPSNP